MILKEAILLLEAKLYDFRHDNVESQLKYWGGGKTSEWVDPSTGYYWEYVRGKLKVFSTENAVYSFVASDPKKIESMRVAGGVVGGNLATLLKTHKDETFESWNKLGGLVHYVDKTITISKESSENKMRQRIIHNMKEFQDALKALMEHDKRITFDWAIKGTTSRVGKKIRDVMKGEREPLTSNRPLVMYHGTSIMRKANILKFGLRPGLKHETYLTSAQEVANILHKLGITNYIIRDDLSVDVRDAVRLGESGKGKLEKIPVQFHHAIGPFSVRDNKLTSLKGCPEYVGGTFICDRNPLKSLEYAPIHVVGGFSVVGTPLKSFHNIHKYIKYIGATLRFGAEIKSHFLGVMFIRGLKSISGDGIGLDSKQKQAIDIINKHLADKRNPHDVQEELIEAGLSEYAKL